MAHGRKIAAELAKELKCSNCKGYLSTPPIMSHPERGNICGFCAVDNTGGTRNKLYELFVENKQFPCNHDGCKRRVSFGNQAKHNQSCPFRIWYDCPFSLEHAFAGKLYEFKIHLQHEHSDNFIKKPSFEIKLLASDKMRKILNIGEYYYTVETKCDSGIKNLKCSVQYLGNYPETLMHKYSLSFMGARGNRQHITDTMDILSLESDPKYCKIHSYILLDLGPSRTQTITCTVNIMKGDNNI